jgi:hypothetical protein
MIVCRNDERTVATAPGWEALLRAAGALVRDRSHDAVVSLVVELGEMEAAVADRLFPDRDGLHPIAMALRRASVAAGHVLVASSRGERDRAADAAGALAVALDSVPAGALPRTITLRVSEGYAYSALHPESYADAADHLWAKAQPAHVICLGIRGIGAGLSGVVAAALERHGVTTSLHTVRPHGHPLDRTLALDDDLASVLRADAAHAWCAIVDEGPGPSGSSFASVAVAVTALGFPPERVVVFPGGNPDGNSFPSASAREVWSRHARYCMSRDVATAWASRMAAAAIDFSAGDWRMHFFLSGSLWPAVHPQHEVRKLWMPSVGLLLRFAGLGKYGARKLARAEALASAGLHVPPGALHNGYLSLPFIDGIPCLSVKDGLIDAVVRHTAFVATRFPAERAPAADAVIEMVETNVRLAFDGAVTLPPGWSQRYRRILEDTPAAELDGRMLPHEWLDTTGTFPGNAHFVKVDALDHHADRFFPGCQDASWDLAAAAVEFELTPGAVDDMASLYATVSGDRGIAARLPYAMVAYLAFRVGYVTLARDALGRTRDARRFADLVDHYRTLLEDLLGRRT